MKKRTRIILSVCLAVLLVIGIGSNAYLSDAENEKIKFALGEVDNTHDLAIALWKASTALQYTVAVRDKFLEAYREIMQMQI